MEQLRHNNTRKRNLRNTDLISEMNRRKKAVSSKIKKLIERINIIEQFKKNGSGLTLNEYLEKQGIDYKRVFSPLGYYTPKGVVVSDDIENEYLTYSDSMNFNENAGYPTPKRDIVDDKDHDEVTSSIFGMTWNPALNQYFPTTVFDTKAYTSAEEMGDSGMDIMGGLKTEDFSNLTNEDEISNEMISMVQGLLIEELDNVEDEIEMIEESEARINGYVDFEGKDSKVVRNTICRNNCNSKHPFSPSKREKCKKECDSKFTPSDKQAQRRDDKTARKDARKEFRDDKRSCKEKRRLGEINYNQYRDCIKKERKEKRSEIKKSGGNFFVRTARLGTKITPITLVGRNGALVLISQNIFGFSTRVAPAILPNEQSQKLFKPNSISKAKESWVKLERAWRNLGGDTNKLREAIIKGHNKRAMKLEKKSSFDGNYYYLEDGEDVFSNFADPTAGVGTGAIVVAGLSVVTALIPVIADTDKDPYNIGMTPLEYRESLNDGSVDDLPEINENMPVLNENGDWIDPISKKSVDPTTGELKDTIFGVNKWVVVGVSIVAIFGIIYLLKDKK